MVIKSLRMRERTEENRKPCSEHQEPSPVSLWALSSWENPADVHKHQFLHFAFIKVVSSPTAREIRVTCCTVSLTSRIEMWRRRFCNTRRDSGIPRRSCYRLYRLPGRITQLPGFSARLAASNYAHIHGCSYGSLTCCFWSLDSQHIL